MHRIFLYLVIITTFLQMKMRSRESLFSPRPCFFYGFAGDVPFFPKISPNRNGGREVHRKHSCRCPTIYEPGVRRIGSVRKPKRSKMRASVVGAVAVVFELKGGAFAGDRPVQQPPIPCVAELGEIGRGVLRRGH